MKVIISEKQLLKLVGKELDEQEETPTDDTTSASSEENPSYPEVGKWESGIVRGPANQVDPKSKWSDVVGSKIVRGHANKLK